MRTKEKPGSESPLSEDAPDCKIADQIARILRSKALHGSEVLRNVLAYLYKASVDRPSESIKAKEIAAAVFGRGISFDSQADSVVRVHVGRLRAKLAEYYLGEGEKDEFIVEVPKGSYSLSLHPRQAITADGHFIQPATPSINPAKDQRGPNRYLRKPIVLSLVSALVAGLAGFYLAERLKSAERPDVPIALWRPFLDRKSPVLIVFSNFRFVASPSEALSGASADTPEASVVDTYTSMGEVLGVFHTSRILTLWDQPLVVKRGRLVTWDEAKDRNLIFVGSTLVASPLQDVPTSGDLQFVSLPGRLNAILNVHPRKGERQYYFGPGLTPHPDWDYAVIAVRPGLSPGHRIMVLAGVTEFGTQAAAEFVTKADSVRRLLSELHVAVNAPTLPNFDALVRVRLKRDVPLDSELVLLHRLR